MPTPELLRELARAEWRAFGSPRDSHKLERADLRSRPDLFFVRKKDNPSQIYMVKARSASTWECLRCGTRTRAARVEHPAHEEPLPFFADRYPSYEITPFCPVCEKEPRPYESAPPLRFQH